MRKRLFVPIVLMMVASIVQLIGAQPANAQTGGGFWLGLAYNTRGDISYPGDPRDCLIIVEPLDPAWSGTNRVLCAVDLHDHGTEWSHSGPIEGKVCDLLTVPGAPGWDNNNLCFERDFGIQWSNSGKIADLACTPIRQSDGLDAFSNAYLCYPVPEPPTPENCAYAAQGLATGGNVSSSVIDLAKICWEDAPPELVLEVGKLTAQKMRVKLKKSARKAFTIRRCFDTTGRIYHRSKPFRSVIWMYAVTAEWCKNAAGKTAGATVTLGVYIEPIVSFMWEVKHLPPQDQCLYGCKAVTIHRQAEFKFCVPIAFLCWNSDYFYPWITIIGRVDGSYHKDGAKGHA